MWKDVQHYLPSSIVNEINNEQLARTNKMSKIKKKKRRNWGGKILTISIADKNASGKIIWLSMQEMQEKNIWSLGWEVLMEKKMATHPFIGHEVMGLDAKNFIFLMPRFKKAFSLPSFIRGLFSSFLLSAIRVVPSA